MGLQPVGAILIPGARATAHLGIARTENQEARMTTTYVPSDWTRALRDFTARNAGRSAALEAHTDLGVFPQAARYTLREAAYNKRESRIEIVLDPAQSNQRAQLRTIADVYDLDVLAGANGRTIALRITHRGGRTVLRFLN
jgi:hypothetical protein